MSFENTTSGNEPTVLRLGRTTGWAGADGLVPAKTGQKCGRDAEMFLKKNKRFVISQPPGLYVKEGLAKS